MATIIVRINGTTTNPFEKYGLTQNPFPQIATYEHSRGCLQMQSLGGMPIKNKKEIADRLQGFTPEFIQLCQDEFVPGEMIEFEVSFPD